MHYSDNIRCYTSWLESLKCIIYNDLGNMNMIAQKIKEIGGFYKPFEIDNGFPSIEQAKEFIDYLEILEITMKLKEN